MNVFKLTAVLVGAAGLVVSIAATLTASAQGPAAAAADAGAHDAPTRVRIIIQTNPPEKAVVFWGRKPLGYIRGPKRPLIVDRPRDSGPLDIIVRAQGFLPVHTRAYTFTDTRLTVKLTPVTEKSKLFGYRQELPDGGADGGVVPAPPPAAPDGGAAVPAQ